LSRWPQTILICISVIISGLLIRQYLERRFPTSDLGGMDISVALTDIDKYHIRKLSSEEKARALLTGLAGSLGPHARVYSPDELVARRDSLEGTPLGIGIVVKRIDGFLTVIRTLEGGPAQSADLKPGDRILSADGKDLSKKSTEETAEILRGPLNSQIVLRLSRPGEPEERSLTIIRGPYLSESVEYVALMSDNETGFARLSDFTANSSTQLAGAFRELASKGAKRFILDLRHNGGGLLEAGVDCADLFISKGVIVTVKSGDQDKPYDVMIYLAKVENDLPMAPLAVLVDGLSASSSEILAGALRFHKRAILVGSKTYGKGSVQRLFSDGLGGWGLKFTTALFYDPGNKKIDGVGIAPNIVVEQSKEDLARAYLKHDTIETRKSLPDFDPAKAESGIPLDEVMSYRDLVLEAAAKALAERNKIEGADK
jgi:carboxyl-terminal processing protease